MGLDTVGAPLAHWAVTDPAARTSVLEAFAPEGPWSGNYGELKRLDEWPDEATVVDFSGDGVPDVVLRPGRQWERVGLQDGRLVFEYYGSTGLGWFELYQWIDGEFVQVGGRRDAHLGRMSREHPWDSATLTVIFTACCVDWALSHYEPSFRGDTLQFHRSLDVLPALLERTQAYEIFDAPRPFVVENQVYSLRSDPRIPGDPAFPHPSSWFSLSPASHEMAEPWEFEGTRMAVYGRGARGVGLATATDDTGRVWWYVLMDPGTPPVEPRFQSSVSLGGWMSSRFLRELGRSGAGGEDPRSSESR